MNDNKQIKDFRDRTKIDINEPDEVEYWSEKFNVSQAAVINAVNKVGISVERVKEFIEGSK